MKVGDTVRHIPLSNGASLGNGEVLRIGSDKVEHDVVLVNFYDYDGKLPVRWMIPETIELVGSHSND